MPLPIKFTTNQPQRGVGNIVFFGILLIILVVYLNFKEAPTNMIELYFIFVCLVGLYIGFVKSKDPFVYLQLNENFIEYFHKFGEWKLSYLNIQRLGIPKVSRGLEHKDLSYIGLSINDYDEFLGQLHPRIAGKLLIEQRPLIRLALSQDCPDGACPSDFVFDDNVFKSPSGAQYSGLIAMFANRMVKLKVLLGYELFIPLMGIEEDQNQILLLLKSTKCNQILKNTHSEIKL